MPNRTGDILLVEDNPNDVELTLRAFKRNNISNEIVVVRDGAEALEYLHGSNHDWRLSVVLLDLKLPKVDGVEVLRAIRTTEATRHLPVVVLTSSREESDLMETYDLAVNSYIIKPVDFDKFMDAVRLIGMYWLLYNETPVLSARAE